MKKINWTEIAIAAPTALVFANLGGMAAMLTVSLLLGISIITARYVAPKRRPAVAPVLLNRES